CADLGPVDADHGACTCTVTEKSTCTVARAGLSLVACWISVYHWAVGASHASKANPSSLMFSASAARSSPSIPTSSARLPGNSMLPSQLAPVQEMGTVSTVSTSPPSSTSTVDVYDVDPICGLNPITSVRRASFV